MEAAVQPVAEGDITRTPVAHLLVYLYDRRRSGVLEVQGPQGELSRIEIQRGRPVAARLAVAADTLADGLLPLCGYRRGSYAFYADRALTSPDGSSAEARSSAAQPGALVEGAVDPYGLVARSLEDHAREDVVEALLARYGDHAMRLQPGRPIERLRLHADGLDLLNLLRASPGTVEELVRASSMAPVRARRLLYLLVITKMVAPFEGRSGRSAVQARVSTRPPAPPTGSDSTGRARSNTESGPVSAARSLASMRASRMRRSGLVAGGRPTSHPALESMEGPDGPQAMRRLAESRLRNGHPSDAVELLQKLTTTEGAKEARVYGLLAWALFEQFRSLGGAGAVPQALVDAIRQAHELDADEAHATYARGLVFKHLGKDRKALACFRRASAAARDLVEAKREVRLLEMRSR